MNFANKQTSSATVHPHILSICLLLWRFHLDDTDTVLTVITLKELTQRLLLLVRLKMKHAISYTVDYASFSLTAIWRLSVAYLPEFFIVSSFYFRPWHQQMSQDWAQPRQLSSSWPYWQAAQCYWLIFRWFSRLWRSNSFITFFY